MSLTTTRLLGEARLRLVAAAHSAKVAIPALARRAIIPTLALVLLLLSMGGTWTFGPSRASASPITQPGTGSGASELDALLRPHPPKKEVTGKLNLNTATEDQLMLLPTIGPSKAERIVTWRKKNGGFKRTADLRRVKGFGYKTFKRLEPYLDIKGDTTLTTKR